MTVRRKYDAEFKKQVVKLYWETKKTKAQIANDFNISESIVKEWIQKYRNENRSSTQSKRKVWTIYTKN